MTLTSRGSEYLQARRAAALKIGDELTATVGVRGMSGLFALLEALDDGESPRMRTYLRRSSRL